MSFIDEKSVTSQEKSNIHISLRSKVREKRKLRQNNIYISLRSKVREKRKLRQKQNLSKSSKRKHDQQPASPLPNITATNDLTQEWKGDDTSSDYEIDDDIDDNTGDCNENDQLEGSSISTLKYHPYVCIFCKKGFMDPNRLNTCFKNCRLIRLNRPVRLTPERQEWDNQYKTEGSSKDQSSLTPPESHQYEFSSEERQRQQLVYNISTSSSTTQHQSLLSSGDITHSNDNMTDPLEGRKTKNLTHASSNLCENVGIAQGFHRNFKEHQRRLGIRKNLKLLQECIPGLIRRKCSQEKILNHAINYCQLLVSIEVKFKKELTDEEERNNILKKKLEHLMHQLDKSKAGDAKKFLSAIKYIDISTEECLVAKLPLQRLIEN